MKLLLKQEEATKRTPATLEDRPFVFDDLQSVLDAYMALDRSRQWGFGAPQAISMAEIAAALDIFGVTDKADRIEWTSLIQSLDEAHAAWRVQKREREERRKKDDDADAGGGDRRKKSKAGR